MPRCHEVVADEGDLDTVRVVQTLRRNGYQGVIIPDHTSEMACPGSWHAGMAFALGYIRGMMRTVEREAG